MSRWVDVRQMPGDLLFALRQYRKNPVFAICVAGILALGIGANTAIFSVIESVILQPLPYPAASRLVLVWEANPSLSVARDSVSGATYLDWKEQNHTFEDLAAFETGTGTLTGMGEPRQLPGLRVSSNFLELLGATPRAGRLFRQSDGEGSTFRNIGVLSYSVWKQEFNADPGAVGRVMNVDLRPYTIIGVTSRDFWFPVQADAMVVWPDGMLRGRNRMDRGLAVLGRLKEGVTIEQARADLNQISMRIAEQTPNYKGWGASVTPLASTVTEGIRSSLFMLFGAVALALLIACINVANLLVARALTREREIAIRSALGAGRARVIQQLLTESTLLALAGGVAGVILAAWMVEGITRLMPASISMRDGIGSLLLRHPEVNPWVLGGALLISLLTGILFGLLPAWSASRTDVRDALQEGSRGSTAGGMGWRRALLGAQMAVTLILLAGCGLMLLSFYKLRSVNPGFSQAGLLAFEIELPTDSRYKTSEEEARFFRDVRRKLQEIPGVASVGMSSDLPMDNRDAKTTYTIEEGVAASAQRFSAEWRVVTPGYMETLKIPLRAGRYFTESDLDGRGLVVLVDEAFAARHWPGENPVGRHIRFTHTVREVAGVVGSVHHAGLAQGKAPTIYAVAEQSPVARMGVAMRVPGDPYKFLDAAKQAVWAVDKDIPVYRVTTMEEAVAATYQNSRITLWLVSGFALGALLLAALGAYGVIAYQTNSRAREFGIRMAMGAASWQVVGLVVKQMAWTLAWAIPAGVLVSMATARVLSASLYSVSAAGMWIPLLAALFLAAIAILSALGPAVRAARGNSLMLLRSE
ncbi:MAG: ABC transporter permease [Bryobacterales bacterium]|nr:ABC transporter permease [Bryobacterales bacterium]